MPDMDLATALNMFKSGVQDLAFSRALGQANDSVQQIKASDLNEQEQRGQLQQLSNGLVMKMAGMGVPASTMQAVAGAVGPKQYANANAMNADALLTGNSGLADTAAQQQAFEQDPEYKMQLMQAKMLNPMLQQKMKDVADERFSKHIEGLDKVVDTQTSRFGNISKLQGTNNQIQDAMTMFANPEQIKLEQIPEIARKFDSILSQGAATVQGSQDLQPHTLNQWLAKSKEFVTSKPQNVNMQDFVNFYKESFQRISDVNNGIIKGAQKNIISARAPVIARKDPEAFKIYVNQKLGEDVDVDPKTGKLTWKGTVGAPAGQSQPAAPQMTPVMVRDKTTGQLIKAMKGADGRLYSAD